MGKMLKITDFFLFFSLFLEVFAIVSLRLFITYLIIFALLEVQIVEKNIFFYYLHVSYLKFLYFWLYFVYPAIINVLVHISRLLSHVYNMSFPRKYLWCYIITMKITMFLLNILCSHNNIIPMHASWSISPQSVSFLNNLCIHIANFLVRKAVYCEKS